MGTENIPDAIYPDVWKAVLSYLTNNATTRTAMARLSLGTGIPPKITINKK